MNIKNIDAYSNKKSIPYCIIFVEIIVVIFVVIIIVNISVEMVICVAIDRKSASRQGKVISFYKFPRNENLKQKWLLKIKRSNIQSMQHARICHLHFKADCFKRDLQVRKYSLKLWSICAFTSNLNLRRFNEKLFKKYAYSAYIVAYFKISFP